MRSDDVENHAHAIALRVMYHNFGCIDKPLQINVAMAAGVADHD